MATETITQELPLTRETSGTYLFAVQRGTEKDAEIPNLYIPKRTIKRHSPPTKITITITYE